MIMTRMLYFRLQQLHMLLQFDQITEIDKNTPYIYLWPILTSEERL